MYHTFPRREPVRDLGGPDVDGDGDVVLAVGPLPVTKAGQVPANTMWFTLLYSGFKTCFAFPVPTVPGGKTRLESSIKKSFYL